MLLRGAKDDLDLSLDFHFHCLFVWIWVNLCSYQLEVPG
jgi:hypothetical protein